MQDANIHFNYGLDFDTLQKAANLLNIDVIKEEFCYVVYDRMAAQSYFMGNIPMAAGMVFDIILHRNKGQ